MRDRGDFGPERLTVRQVEILRLAAGGMTSQEIARQLGISPRTVEGHVVAARTRTGSRNLTELVARCYTAGIFALGRWPPSWPDGCQPDPTANQATDGSLSPDHSSEQPPLNPPFLGQEDLGPRGRPKPLGERGLVDRAAPLSHRASTLRVGYARLSGRPSDDRMQVDALKAADCRKLITERVGCGDGRPRLRHILNELTAGDTLVIYRPDRVARSVREFRALLEDAVYANGVKLHILGGSCAGMHTPSGSGASHGDLLAAVVLAAELERDMFRERTLDGLAAAKKQGRRGGRPAAIAADVLAAALERRAQGESMAEIAQTLHVGRSTLYRAIKRAVDADHA